MSKLKKIYKDHNIELLGLTEGNKDWRTIEYENKIWGATLSFTNNKKIQVAQNITTSTEATEHQVGGIAFAAFGDLVLEP